MSKDIKLTDIQKYQNNVDQRKDAKVIARAVQHNGILAASTDFHAYDKDRPFFSVELHQVDVTDQKRAGFCWLFAALNTLRDRMINKLNLKNNFELSENYINFWDKLEKSNFYLVNVLRTAKLPLSNRYVWWINRAPESDGGQWDMLCALIEKYGVVPKQAMGSTHNTVNSDELNSTLNAKLRIDAVTLRKAVAKGASKSDLDKTKGNMLNDIYRILVYAFGAPVKKFNFEYYDKKNNYHIDKDLTPKKFYDKYVGLNLENYVSVINSPTKDKPYNKTYTVDMLGNVVGGRQVKHLNLTMDDFEKLAVTQLKHGESVWFGSDVVQYSDSKKGVMDDDLYHKDSLFDTKVSMSKEDALNYGESAMDHAMVLTGVDIVNGKPTKWKVENSWGKKPGNKGYFVMSESWFRRFAYQLVINKKYMPEAMQKDQAQKPSLLKPWDPMGTLA
ncbi:aminopeptidase C [Acetilactobacillus jinshanensis]|uniref:Aminopeptidase n=1 Tax=Acetilactobacillus jinshanensis TaxID=1720083 RepID=A0A4V1ALU9_9LACO|nr:C1 family peptidase [Acetilactobacillus jinshanensis]QBP18859.1 aminopeptidase [Acetilactobacillus jinshanensis]URL61726.1 C1 family peptidase [uncultured bacterium]